MPIIIIIISGMYYYNISFVLTHSRRSESVENSVKTPCRNTVFEKYQISPIEVSASCKNSYCKVVCIATGTPPTFNWPDGTTTKRENFKCQKGEMWKPNVGTITCP